MGYLADCISRISKHLLEVLGRRVQNQMIHRMKTQNRNRPSWKNQMILYHSIDLSQLKQSGHPETKKNTNDVTKLLYIFGNAVSL